MMYNQFCTIPKNYPCEDNENVFLFGRQLDGFSGPLFFISYGFKISYFNFFRFQIVVITVMKICAIFIPSMIYQTKPLNVDVCSILGYFKNKNIFIFNQNLSFSQFDRAFGTYQLQLFTRIHTNRCQQIHSFE